MAITVAVTGASGYIGRHVVSALANRGASVIAVDIAEPDVDPRAERRVLDVFDANPNIYADLGEPDVLLHLAWRNGFQHNAQSHITDLPGHFLFLKNLLDSGLRHIAVMGSMHEIGYHEGAIEAETPCVPGSLYGVGKNALRQSLEVITNNKEVVFQWIRAFYIVGDDRHNNSIFARILEASDEGKTKFPFTTGKNLYDFISVDQLADQISAIVLQDDISGIINACTGNPVSLAQRVESFIVENDLDLTLEYGAFPDRPYDSPGVWGDSTKIDMIMSAASDAVK